MMRLVTTLISRSDRSSTELASAGRAADGRTSSASVTAPVVTRHDWLAPGFPR
jgi:hypothetical protein